MVYNDPIISKSGGTHMKKKNLLLIIGGNIVLVLIVLLVFLLTGNNSPQTSNEPGMAWKVITEVKDGEVKYPKKGFFVFTEEKVTEYRDGSSEAYLVSDYTYTESESGDGILDVPAFSQVYEVEVITENYIRLHEGDSSYKELIRYANGDCSDLNATQDDLSGKWELVYIDPASKFEFDRLVFSGSLVVLYPIGSDKAIATDCSWNGSTVTFDGRTLQFYPVSEDVVMMVENETYFIWELYSPSYNYTD